MDDLETALLNFIGTQHYYHHNIGDFNYTDGVKFLVENAKCYWLLDLIGSYQHESKVKNVPFQLWNLRVNKNQRAVITMKEDSDTPVIIRQIIPYTDFPLKQIKLYLTNGVLMLPSEY